MKKQAFPFVTHFKDRHGKLRWRYRKDGLTISLGTDYGSEDFLRKYNAAVRGERIVPGQAAGVVLSGSTRGSLSHVITSWYKTAKFNRLGATTSNGYRLTAEKLREEHGDKTVVNLKRRHILDIMAKKTGTPNAANYLLRLLRLILDHALDLDLVETNVARTVKNLPASTDGYHTWTEGEIAQFYAKHPAGTLAHTAMTLMLYTGAGRADAAALGPRNMVAGRLEYRRVKMKTRQGILVSIPVHPVLAECLVDVPAGQTTYLQTAAGLPRSPDGLGKSMREWCDDAELPECSSHGLRKACARRLIEAGATPHEMMAVTGHKTLAEAQRYALDFDRTSAADRAMGKQSG